MKLRLASVVRCPVCRGPLVLHVFRGDKQTLDATSQRELDERGIEPASVEQLVRDGVFECTNCRAWYPIVERVPVLLDFATPVHAQFAERHRAKLDDLDADLRAARRDPARCSRNDPSARSGERSATTS